MPGYSIQLTGRIDAHSEQDHTSYTIHVTSPEGVGYDISRRYNAFEELSKHFRRTYPNLPEMPGKSYFRKALLASFNDERQKALDALLRAIAGHDPYASDPKFEAFLQPTADSFIPTTTGTAAESPPSSGGSESAKYAQRGSPGSSEPASPGRYRSPATAHGCRVCKKPICKAANVCWSCGGKREAAGVVGFTSAPAAKAAPRFTLDEHGYAEVARHRSNAEMEAFIRSVVEQLGLTVVNEGTLFEVVPEYSGLKRTQSYSALVKDLLDTNAQPGGWVTKHPSTAASLRSQRDGIYYMHIWLRCLWPPFAGDSCFCAPLMMMPKKRDP